MQKSLLHTFLFLFLTTLFSSPVTWAQDSISFSKADVIVCSATPQDTAPPDFSLNACAQQDIADIDPQNTMVWIKAKVLLDELTGPEGEPLSLFISGKMSSKAYLNGALIGQNGVPALDASQEVPGKMDAELFPPQELFRLGENEIILQASAHHGKIHLARPLHMIAIAPASFSAKAGRAQLILSLVTLGVFGLSALYFGIMAILSETRIRFATLSAISFFASGQLLFETLRGLVQYDYPFHEVRLVAIALFSAAFGLSVAFHVLRTFMTSYLKPVIAGLAVLCALALVLIPGFDYKALIAMSMPLLASLIGAGVWTFQKRSRAFAYFLALLVFLIAIAIFRALFLDTVFFLLVAFFLLLLFVEQAFTLVEEARERRAEEARANRLAQALAEAEERSKTSHIDIKSAGKLERIATSQIIHCKGANGYSEIILVGGRTVLHSASLNEMEKTLPATFLRVHRSHLINVMFVQSLSRDPSGTGTLVLTEGEGVPVSRRVMPSVRRALG